MTTEELQLEILFKEREIIYVKQLLQHEEKRLTKLQSELYLLEKQLQELKINV